jgi:PAS domain S-box-containing protein
MQLSAGAYIVIFAFCSGITGLFTVWLYSKAETRETKLFVYVSVLVTIWSVFELLKVLSDGTEIVYYFHLGTLIVGFNVPILWLLFSLEFSGNQKYTKGIYLKSIAALIVVLSVANMSDPIHHLLINESRKSSDALAYTSAVSGPLYEVNTAIIYLASAASILVLIHLSITSRNKLRNSANVLLVAIFTVMITNVLVKMDIPSLNWITHTAFSFPAFCGITAYALTRQDLLDITPRVHSAILREMEEPVIITDTNWNIVEFNNKAEESFSELEGRNMADILPEVVEYMEENSEEESISKTTSITENGEIKYYKIKLTSVYTESGSLHRYSLIFSDITELNKYSKQLQYNNERLERFASTVSHDIRNPLTVAKSYNQEILSVSEELLEDFEDENIRSKIRSIQDYAREVDDSADRIDEIIENILEKSTEEENVEVEPHRFSDIIESAWSQVDTREATLEFEQNGTVFAEEASLKSCFENLFRNSIEHGGDDVTVTVKLSEDSFEVLDNGSGIPEDIAANAFDYGVSEDEEGTGIGLSTVKDLSDEHGWNTRIDTDYTGGARIIFENVDISLD